VGCKLDTVIVPVPLKGKVVSSTIMEVPPHELYNCSTGLKPVLAVIFMKWVVVTASNLNHTSSFAVPYPEVAGKDWVALATSPFVSEQLTPVLTGIAPLQLSVEGCANPSVEQRRKYRIKKE
jgi:hypothetical protein